MKREVYLQSSLPQETVLKRLMMHTTIRSNFYYPERIDERIDSRTNSVIKYKPYYGFFQDNSFTIAQSYPVRQMPIEVIRGEVLPKEDGCTLHYRIHTFWFYLIVYAFIVVLCPILLYVLISEFNLEKPLVYLLVIAYLIEAGAFFMYEHHCAKTVIETVYEDFSKMLK